MPTIEEQERSTPDFFVIKDVANNGVLRAIIGFRCVNNVTYAVRVNITYGPQHTVWDWWTPLGRPDGVIQVGETVTSQPFRINAGLADWFGTSIGPA